MKRIRLTVAYDGTNYCGWQLQPNGITIEEVLNRALSELLKEEIQVVGASRTDSGVHAMGNIAVFDTESRIPPEKICFALNQRLPEDVRVQKSEEVPLTFHPRKANCVKTYEYKILNRKIDMPLNRLYCHFCYFDLDVEKMRRAAAFLVGEHDFKSFCTVRTQAEETVRTIYSLTVDRGADDVIVIRISGSGFLYNMVRIITGTLVKIGMGVWPPEYMEEILEARDRAAAGPTIPAKGLTLVSMEYEKEPADCVRGENRHWSYCLDQRHLSEGYSVLTIERCEDGELDGVLRRMIHQAVRNGAKRVYVTDTGLTGPASAGPEAAGTGERTCGAAGRLHPGDKFGYYRLAEPDPEGEASGSGFLTAVYEG